MKKNYSLLRVLLLLLFSIPINAIGQITVVPNQTAATLATKLVGAGVTMLNPTLTCLGSANGTFSGTSSLSFDSGIVLTNGSAANTSRPASFFSSVANGTAGNALLSALIGGTVTYDACILQFDFRPAGDTIKFQYVFGSEEYTDYTCSPYNDVFGFLISGPGLAANTNIALVPGTNIPVCINSVNCGGTGGYPTSTCRALGTGAPFCTYYVNNLTGTTIVYDGLTTTLTAISAVTPCDTYHLFIGVADATDDIYDSGVFLKAGSLTSTSFSSTTVGMDPADTGFGSQYCIRGCLPGEFIFHNTGSLTDSIIVHYSIGGTAVNGFDYSTIPDSTIIHANDSTDTVFIYGLTSATGTKTVELYIYAPYSCGAGPTIMDSVELTIYDTFAVHIITPDTTVCIGQSVLINTSGPSNINYSWSPSATLNSSTLQSPTATPPLGTTTYTVTAGLPGCPLTMADVSITAAPPPGPPTVTDPNYCQNEPFIPFTITATGTVYWYPSAAGTGGTTTIPTVNTALPGTYTYYFNQIIGSCISSIDSITIVVTPAITDSFSYAIHRGCGVDSVTCTSITTNATSYSWDFGDGSPLVTTPNAVHAYATQGNYTITLTCHNVNCVDTFSQQINTHHGITAVFAPNPDTFCAVNPIDSTTMDNSSSSFAYFTAATQTNTSGGLQYSWNFGDGNTDNTINPTHIYANAGNYIITLTITDSIDCPSTIHQNVFALRTDINSWHDTTLCLKQPLPLNNLVTLYMPNVVANPTFSYSWSESTPNLDNPNVQVPNLSGFGVFTDILTATNLQFGCFAIDTMNIHSVLGQLLTNVTPNAVIEYGSSIQLNSDNELYYYWKPDDGSLNNPNINNPVATPVITTIYTVYGMDQYGCVDSAFVTIDVDSAVNQAIPNAFSPNGDGLNDVFRPIGLKYQRLVEFRVFNRWGQQLFYSNDAEKGWDGTFNGVPQDIGVYYYQVIIALPDGTNKVYKGDVTLIR